MDSIVDLLGGLLITGVFYCAVPAFAALSCKTKITQKYFRNLCIVSIIQTAIMCLFVATWVGLTWQAYPSLIWGFIAYEIGYSVLKKRGLLTQEPKKEKPVPPAQQVTQAQQETYYICPGCGCLVRTGEVCACGFRGKTQTQEENT